MMVRSHLAKIVDAVAQTSSLPYRGFPIRQRLEGLEVPTPADWPPSRRSGALARREAGKSTTQQIGNLRYFRLTKSAKHAAGTGALPFTHPVPALDLLLCASW